MVDSKIDGLDELMALSHDSSNAARSRLFENMSGLFLSEGERLSEQERAHISDILGKLISDVETQVRTALSTKLAASNNAPGELVALLANDTIEVARPLLFKSRVLLEPDLMEIIEKRSKEHLMVVAERDDINAMLSEALIEYGDEDVIENLLKNSDAEISKETMALLVEESKRVDRFQEPLLARHDLPKELAHKMFWWVSAALRRYILQNFEIDSFFLDQQVAEVTQEVRDDINIADFGETHADKLVAQLASRNELTERFLVQAIKSNQIRLFVAGLSLKSGLDTKIISRFLHDKNTEAMAVTCKALDLGRNSFSAIYLLSRKGLNNNGEKTRIDPAEIESAIAFFDKLKTSKAKSVLDYWKIETGYSDAIADLDNRLDTGRVYL